MNKRQKKKLKRVSYWVHPEGLWFCYEKQKFVPFDEVGSRGATSCCVLARKASALRMLAKLPPKSYCSELTKIAGKKYETRVWEVDEVGSTGAGSR